MKALAITISVCLLTACTKLTVEESLPNLDGIGPSNIQSQLRRINIVSDPDSFAYMYTNFLSEIVIAAQIEYYDEGGIFLFDEAAKIKIRGSGSAYNDMKSIGVVFENKINNDSFQMVESGQALPGDDLGRLQSIRLRNSGNDDGITHIKDLALTNFAIAHSIDLELKYGRPVQVFTNGNYFGLLSIRTENDRLALSDKQGVDSASITMMKADIKNGNIEYKEGDEALAQSLRQAIKDDDGIQIENLLDVDNFIDYILFQDYVQNTDWPHNNARLYSVDGAKFRFLLFDLDLAFTRPKMQRLPRMEFMKDDISKIYQILRERDHGFIDKLEVRQKEMYKAFSPEGFNAIVDELAEQIEGDIPYVIRQYGKLSSTLQWRINLENMKRSFEVNDRNNRRKYGLN